MATITASLEKSLKNCSLNHQHSSSSSSSDSGGGDLPHPSDSPPPPESSTPTVELNSQASLPFHWEQCLDLKTGEIYFINWRTGMKATEDPRVAAEYGGDYSEEDSSSYESDGSSSESSPSSSREQWSGKNIEENCCYGEMNENSSSWISNNINSSSSGNAVLVVAGCKSCLMYYMVPRQHEICPKCCGQLLHFDRSENGSS